MQASPADRLTQLAQVVMNRSTSFSSQPDSNGLENWLVGFCTIRFDLEQGQVVEECYPAGVLSPEEELDVAFSSFPDSMANAHAPDTRVHDIVFFFRSRRRGQPQSLSTARRSLTRSTSTLPFKADDTTCPGPTDLGSELLKKKRNEKPVHESNGLGKGGQKYLFGYVFNRQIYDERLKRGGEQKSVLVLSEWPLYCVFKPLVQYLGPLYFDTGIAALEQVALQISRWPKPKLGCVMELMLGKTLLRAHLPPVYALPPGPGCSTDVYTSAMAPVTQLIVSVPQSIFHDVDLYRIFKGHTRNLWTLWELILIGEPLLVISPTPSQCCEAVAGLVSLIAPLPSSVDFRPYFTIHDPDFRVINSSTVEDRIPPMVLGVTNVFFLKSLKVFRHILSVGVCNASSGRERKPAESRFGRQLQVLRQFSPTKLLARKEGPLSLMSEHREELWTCHAPVTRADEEVLKKLVNAPPSLGLDESTSVVNNDILRRYFSQLTTNFLAPFGPYLRPNTPQEGASPFVDPPPLPPFDAVTFLEGLEARGPGTFLNKRMNSQWLTLYRNFLAGPNFMPWFQRRRSVAEQEQHRIWRDACSKADVRVFLRKMTEVEIVDSFEAVQRRIAEEMKVTRPSATSYNSAGSFRKMTEDLKAIYEFLPKELQVLVVSNPQYARVLGLANRAEE